MEYIPIEARIAIYSFVDDINEPIRYYDRKDCQAYLSEFNFSEEILKAFDLLEPQIKIAVVMNDMKVLRILLPQITEPILQQKAARLLARLGCLTGLQWYCQDYKIPLQEDLCECAAFGGHRHIIQWIMQQTNQKVWKENTDLCTKAAYGGHLKLLQWLHEQGYEWNEDTCGSAASGGHFEVLKYAHENDCPWNAYTCTFAAEDGRLDILKYAHEHGCPWDESTYTGAALYEQYEVLKYLHVQGCPWSEDTFRDLDDELEIPDYLRERGCPGSQLLVSEDDDSEVSEEEQDDETERDENGE